MFHREVLGLPSRNLDLFFSGEDQARALLSLRRAGGRGVAVLEGVMGCYDGVGGTERASSWHLARTTGTPILLVVRPQGAALTLAAMVQGAGPVPQSRYDRRASSQWLLPGAGGTAHAHAPKGDGPSGAGLAAPAARLRHRKPAPGPAHAGGGPGPGREGGPAGQPDGGRRWIWRASWPWPGPPPLFRRRPPPPRRSREGPVVAVAQDRAFCFYYEENLELLRRNGLRLAEFSPLEDRALPAGTLRPVPGRGLSGVVGGAAQPGTPPCAGRSGEAIRGGMPALAECGGFLYLQRSLEDPEGRAWPMAGVLAGEGTRSRGRQPFGYLTLRPEGGQPLSDLRGGDRRA